MVVMSRSPERDYGKARASGSFLSAKEVPIDMAGSGKEIADKIREGCAVLKIVATPWGVEFYVVGMGKEP
jgi:hypothetical protein